MQQVQTPVKSTIFAARQIYFVARHDFHVAMQITFTLTVKHVAAAIHDNAEDGGPGVA